MAPTSYAEVAEIVREAEARRTPIVPAGLGSHAYLGNPPPDGATVVSLRHLNRVLRYEPGDFTVGVQAGCTLAALRSVLGANDQEVPADLTPDSPGTIGGLVAAAPPGLRRGRHGPIRGFVIGATALRGGPSVYKTGGMVVKNVAGYEIAKLLTGSLGTAGFLLEVNFKLRPLPARRVGRAAAFESRAAAWTFAQALRARNLEPAALWVIGRNTRAEAPEAARALAFERLRGPLAVWIFEGNEGAVAWQEAEARGVLSGHRHETLHELAAPELDSIVHHLGGVGSPGSGPRDDLGIVRLAALPTEAARLEEATLKVFPENDGFLAEAAADVVSGLITLRWTGPEDQVDAPIPRIAAVLRERGASGVLVYLPPARRRAHDYLLIPDSNRELARKLLRVFDPAGIFCPGRVLGA